jgi:hypothetical protein
MSRQQILDTPTTLTTPATPASGSTPTTSSAVASQIRIASHAFRYGEYGQSTLLTRNLRLSSSSLQMIVNTICDDALIGQEVEIAVKIQDRTTDQTLFETFWLTSLIHQKQQSAFIFQDLPPELRSLQIGRTYTYYASIQVAAANLFTERITRVIVC